jgi:hypothetical protein
MTGATLLKTSEFAKAMVENMSNVKGSERPKAAR